MERSKYLACCLGLCMCIMRIKDLLFACWMFADMILDGVTTNVYYDMAYNDNSTYRTWDLHRQANSNSTHTETFSAIYFICAMCIWILPALCVPIIALNRGGLISFSNISYLSKDCNLFFRVFILLLITLIMLSHMLIYFLGGVAFVYIFVPIAAIYHGIAALYFGSTVSSSRSYYEDAKYMDSKMGPDNSYKILAPRYFPILKLAELIFGAVPQFTIALVFCINNYHHLKDNDVIFIFPTTNTKIFATSMVFPLVALFWGLQSGFVGPKKCYRRKEISSDVAQTASRELLFLYTNLVHKIQTEMKNIKNVLNILITKHAYLST